MHGEICHDLHCFELTQGGTKMAILRIMLLCVPVQEMIVMDNRRQVEGEMQDARGKCGDFRTYSNPNKK
tara:strand:+ start:675 stop:881 length:207 start_codon:yes stop_codon:yes gene_type:complete